MEPMTLGDWLLVNEQWTDDYRREPHDWARDLEQRYLLAWHSPGMADLRAIAESEGEVDGVSVGWLRRRRGDLRRSGLTVATIDAMTIPVFADALTPRQSNVATADKTDKKTDNEKKLPPHDVNDCARYIRNHWRLVSEGKATRKSRKELIIEAVGLTNFGAMDRQFRKDRYGYLLTLPDK